MGKFKVTRRKMSISCPVFIFLMEKHWMFLLHTKIAYDLRMCHALDPSSFGKVQGHLKEKFIFCVWSSSFLRRNIESYFKQRLLMTWGWVVILTQGHLCNFKVTEKKRCIIHVWSTRPGKAYMVHIWSLCQVPHHALKL